jgi:protein-tyrosine phosphatase
MTNAEPLKRQKIAQPDNTMPHCPEPFVDIHCHMLPCLDDGASSREEALAMAEAAVADGIATIIATPHQLGNHSQNSGQMIREAAVEFQRLLDQRHVPLQILPGADVRIEPDLLRRIRIGDVVTSADRRRHVLLELPHDVYVPLDRLLEELRAAGIVGILSHPERNRGLLRQPDVLHHLVERGCLLQVTAGSLTGAFGSQVQKFADSLVEQGLVHFVATDAHGVKSRPPLLGPAFARVVDLAGDTVAIELFCLNPKAVATGGTIPRRRQKIRRPAWIGRFCQMFASEQTSAGPMK